MPKVTDHQKCSWLCVSVLAFGIAGVAGTARILGAAFEKVMSGQGLDTYRTVWLVEFNYVGILVLFGAMILALILGAGLWLHEWWQIRTLEKKYGSKKATPNPSFKRGRAKARPLIQTLDCQAYSEDTNDKNTCPPRECTAFQFPD